MDSKRVYSAAAVAHGDRGRETRICSAKEIKKSL